MTPEELKAARESAGLTRTELGAAIGRTERSIYRYESGQIGLDGPTTIAIETALGRNGTRTVQGQSRRKALKRADRG